MSPLDYYPARSWAFLRETLNAQDTPCVAIDLHIIRQKYLALKNAFAQADVYYAVKANPAAEIITLLRDLGSSFDIASIYELNKVMDLGVGAERISFGNTIKKRKHVREFFARGVRLFATDSESDLRMIAQEAPGARIYVRVLTEQGDTADWPLSRKFGCEPGMAVELLTLAQQLGLQAYGLSFHVGSQQRDIGAWDAALATVRSVFERLHERGIQLQMINMGGGFPANYISRTHELEKYASAIHQFLQEDFGETLPRLILEPGRSIIADAGLLASEVVLVSRKSPHALNRWVFADIGKFGGLIETLDEAIKYPIFTDRDGSTEEVILAGPTCDSADILYENHKYALPLSLQEGDRLYFATTGAYTTSYSSIEFNGFPPLRAVYIDSQS